MTDTEKLLLTTAVTIALAFIGYLVTYFNSLRLTQRAERLARVNRQLAELYGPLFALSEASDMAWNAFRRKYRPDVQGYFDQRKPISEEDLQAWRMWMETVFMPTNLRIYECILSKSDLLVESTMPQCLLDLCAHVTAYQPVLKAWGDRNYSEHKSLINYPTQPVLDYTRSSFHTLKSKQAKLMGHSTNEA